MKYRCIVICSTNRELCSYFKSIPMPSFSYSIATVTRLANFGFTTLLWRLQGPQGCLEKQKYPLNSNLAVWAQNQESSINFKNERKNIKKMIDTFQSFLVLGPILAHQTTKSELGEWFCFSRHPWGPWRSQSSGMKPKSADSVTVYRYLRLN